MGQVFLELGQLALQDESAAAACVADDRDQHFFFVQEQARVIEKWDAGLRRDGRGHLSFRTGEAGFCGCS